MVNQVSFKFITTCLLFLFFRWSILRWKRWIKLHRFPRQLWKQFPRKGPCFQRSLIYQYENVFIRNPMQKLNKKLVTIIESDCIISRCHVWIDRSKKLVKWVSGCGSEPYEPILLCNIKCLNGEIRVDPASNITWPGNSRSI